MSYFDTSMLCMNCVEKERKHPDYKWAKEIEHAEVRSGNFNFKGIGLPKD